MDSDVLERSARQVESVEQSQIDLLDKFEKAVNSINRRDDQKFRWAIKNAVDLLHLTHQTIAEEFGISRPSVTRWINGQNSPHPAVRVLIYQWIASQAAALRRKKEYSSVGTGRSN